MVQYLTAAGAVVLLVVAVLVADARSWLAGALAVALVVRVGEDLFATNAKSHWVFRIAIGVVIVAGLVAYLIAAN